MPLGIHGKTYSLAEKLLSWIHPSQKEVIANQELAKHSRQPPGRIPLHLRDYTRRPKHYHAAAFED